VAFDEAYFEKPLVSYQCILEYSYLSALIMTAADLARATGGGQRYHFYIL